MELAISKRRHLGVSPCWRDRDAGQMEGCEKRIAREVPQVERFMQNEKESYNP
jgi:hypothetical protein